MDALDTLSCCTEKYILHPYSWKDLCARMWHASVALRKKSGRKKKNMQCNTLPLVYCSVHLMYSLYIALMRTLFVLLYIVLLPCMYFPALVVVKRRQTHLTHNFMAGLLLLRRLEINERCDVFRRIEEYFLIPRLMSYSSHHAKQLRSSSIFILQLLTWVAVFIVTVLLATLHMLWLAAITVVKNVLFVLHAITLETVRALRDAISV